MSIAEIPKARFPKAASIYGVPDVRCATLGINIVEIVDAFAVKLAVVDFTPIVMSQLHLRES